MGELVERAHKRDTLPFHPNATQKVVEISSTYSRQVGTLAEELALRDQAAEIQPGHIERARNAVHQQREQQSAIRRGLKVMCQIVGSPLLGVGATGIALGTALTVAAALGYIAALGIGMGLTCIGIMIKD